MDLSSAAAASTVLLTQLITAALRTTALAAGAMALLTILRVRSTSARLFTWTAILYAGLSIPALGWLLPPLAVRVPFLAKTNGENFLSVRPDTVITIRSISAHQKVVDADKERDEHSVIRAGQMRVLSEPADRVARSLYWTPMRAFVDWPILVGIIYGVGSLFLFVRFVVGLRCVRSLIRTAKLIDDSGDTLRLACALKTSKHRTVRAYESSRVFVPLTAGVFSSSIVLPSDWREWNIAKLDAVFAHEMSHVSRHDALSQCLSLVHRAIFWFSPLAWWLNHQIIQLAEECSDEEVLSQGAEPTQYARTVLGFVAALQAAPSRSRWQAISMANIGRTERRLEKILVWSGRISATRKSAIVMIIAFAIPAVYLSAAIRPTRDSHLSQLMSSVPERLLSGPTEGLAQPAPASLAPARPRLRASSGKTIIPAVFKAVSIRAVRASRMPATRFTANTFTATNVTLQMLIRAAYRVADNQISNAHTWLNSDTYNIRVKIDQSVVDALQALSEDQRLFQRRKLLQEFLAEYFHVVVHQEDRGPPIYDLVIAENGPRLQPEKLDEDYRHGATRPDGLPLGPHARLSVHFASYSANGAKPDQLVAQAVPMSLFAQALEQHLNCVVVDKTGLTGNYNFTLKWKPDVEQGPVLQENVRTSIFAALQSQLGLRLESRNEVTNVLVIDHAEKPAQI